MSEDEHVRTKEDLEARRDPVSPGNGPEVLIRPVDLLAVVVERVARGVPAGGSRDAVPTWCRNEAGIRTSRSPGAS